MQCFCKAKIAGSNPVEGSEFYNSNMKINLWYCTSMKKWRWTLADESNRMCQESGQQTHLRDAMNDVANTVEYILECKQSE
tara:strand:+ start:64 stop:306 length:243 start_codon:yes stop_codon:yes gene_type:complete